MKAPTVSVILPVYNASSFVNEAIESILAQDYRDFELLIANDGSTDDSGEKIRQHSDPRIRIIDNATNQGLITTLNACMTECRGEFIARMDADDIAAPSRFSKQLSAFKNNAALGLVSSFMEVMDEPGTVIKHRFTQPDQVKAALPFTNPIVHPAVMFRTSALPERELYNKTFLHAEDYGAWIELMPRMEFEVLPFPLINHRRHKAQVSVQHYEQQKRSITKAHELLCTYLGFTASEEELNMQLSLFIERFEPNGDYADRAEKWLLKLTEANRKMLLMPVQEFENRAGEWWFRLNQELASVGASSMKRYKRSELAKMYTPSLASSARLLARSVVRGKKTNTN